MKTGRILAFLTILLVLVSCATKPKPVIEDTDIVETDEQPERKAELEALYQKVLIVRKEAFDRGAKELYPDEYSRAEGYFTSGRSSIDSGDFDQAELDLLTALPLYEELAEKSAATAAEKSRDDAGNARKLAVANGAEAYSYGLLRAGDLYTEEGDEYLETGDFVAAWNAYRNAILAYDAAEKHARASEVKNSVDFQGFGEMDAGNYQLAGEKLEEAENTIDTDPGIARDAAAEALLRYNLVYAKGWELSAGIYKADAEKYKTESENIKAQVALRYEYDEALAVYMEAEALYGNEKYEDASHLYIHAENLFHNVYDEAAIKRANAEAALKAAAEHSEQSTNVAIMGDMMLTEEDEE